MSGPQRDVLIEKTIRDVKHGDAPAAQRDLQDILFRDTDLRNPANKNAVNVREHLMQDGEALHAGAGLSHGLLQKLGFPDPMIEKTIHDLQAKNGDAAMRDVQQLLARDATPSDRADKQLKDDHQSLHAAGMPDNALVKLGFPMPDIQIVRNTAR
jgi:hypothetical protein